MNADPALFVKFTPKSGGMNLWLNLGGGPILALEQFNENLTRVHMGGSGATKFFEVAESPEGIIKRIKEST